MRYLGDEAPAPLVHEREGSAHVGRVRAPLVDRVGDPHLNERERERRGSGFVTDTHESLTLRIFVYYYYFNLVRE